MDLFYALIRSGFELVQAWGVPTGLVFVVVFGGRKLFLHVRNDGTKTLTSFDPIKKVEKNK